MKKHIFLALTTYHLMISDIYASYILNSYGEKSVVIYLGNENILNIKSDSYEFVQLPNLNKNFSSRIWQRLYYSGRLFSFSPLSNVIKDVTNSILFVFNDYYPLSRALIEHMTENNNIVCLIDEGIGTYAKYLSRPFLIKDHIRNLFTKMLGAPMVYAAIGESPEIRYAIVENPELYKDKECSKNQVVIGQDKKRIFYFSDLFIKHICNTNLNKLSGEILFLGQPLMESDSESEIEKEFLNKVFDCFREIGKTVIIKPHPRENIKKYSRLCENQKVVIVDEFFSILPVECLVNTYGVKFVVAYNSSAAINIAKCFPGIHVILLLKADFADEISKNKSHSNMDYNHLIFRNANISLVKSYDEMISVLNTNYESCVENQNENLRFKFEEIDYLFNKVIYETSKC